MLKKPIVFYLYLLLLLSGATCNEAFAQESSSFKLDDDSPLIQDLLNVKTKSDKFNLFLNLHGGFGVDFNNDFTQGRFFMRDCRIEAKGRINPWLAYRYRQKLNVSSEASRMIDHMPHSLDYAYLDFKLSDRFSMIVGRQFSAYGGIEFDLDPIEVYHYSDFIAHSIGFVTGAMIRYKVTDDHLLSFQIANNRTYKSFQEEYGVDRKDSHMPLVYTLNWNGKFGEYFIPRWSFSFMNLAERKNMYFLSLGNLFNFGKFGGYFDFMYSKEELDHKGMMREMINMNNEGEYLNLPASYMTCILELSHRIGCGWNCFIKGTYETSSLKKDFSRVDLSLSSGKYRDTFSGSCGVEYYPSSSSNLHFFMTYWGKYYVYTSSAREIGWNNSNEHLLAMGFVYQLPLF